MVCDRLSNSSHESKLLNFIQQVQTHLTPFYVINDCIQDNIIKDQIIHFTVSPSAIDLEAGPNNDTNMTETARLMHALQNQN